ncbi:MAG: response regulator transcription factor [Gaiellaceae bacterium]
MPTLPRELRELKYEGQELTPGQHRVLRQIALGLTGPEVADELGISPETVKRQLAITRSKLGASTTAQAVAIAVSLDLI